MQANFVKISVQFDLFLMKCSAVDLQSQQMELYILQAVEENMQFFCNLNKHEIIISY